MSDLVTTLEVNSPLGALSSSGPLYNAVASLFQNGTFGLAGYVSPAAKQDIVKQEAQALVQASGGTMSLDAATAQANSDVTGILTQSQAVFLSFRDSASGFTSVAVVYFHTVDSVSSPPAAWV